MRQLLKLHRHDLVILFILVLLTIPSFARMLRLGIFSMQDFHLFRLFEFHRCIMDLQIPCRWSPDSSFEYGQPLFNFYNQIVYAIGEPFHLVGLQFIDTIKLLFILSLVGSAIGMFFLARQIWKSNWSAFLAALLYVYAPYRAVDVWVRGALPEAFAFVFFPLIILFFNRYVLNGQRRDLLLFSLLLALLLLTHNLSFLMFSMFLTGWAIYFLTVNKKWLLFKNLVAGSVLAGLMSSFYLLPIAAESKLVTVGETTEGYYAFQLHFTSLYQLFVSRTWGYGASQWGVDDPLSFSIGHIQWVVSLLLVVLIFATKKIRQNLQLLVVIAIGWFALFLTHGKSVFLWESLPPIAFVQFPWRFLSISTFAFALASGGLLLFLKNFKLKIVALGLIAGLAIFLNIGFFKEDIWFNTTDKEQFTGEIWAWHTSSARNDFWPKYAKKIPIDTAPTSPVFLEGSGEILSFNKTSNGMNARLFVSSGKAILQFPSVYFDGWRGFVDDKQVQVYSEGDYGQITMTVDGREHNIDLQFTNTPVRTLGNILSLVSIGVFGFLLLKRK